MVGENPVRWIYDQLQVGLGISHFHVKIFVDYAAHCKEEIVGLATGFISRHRGSKAVRKVSVMHLGPTGTTSTTCSHGLAYIVGLSI